MAATHPDFSEIQRRLRRLDPSWYPESIPIDDDWGPSMSRGVRGALAKLEAAAGLPVVDVVPSAPVPRPAGLLPKFAFLMKDPLPPLMVRLGLEMLGVKEVTGVGNNPIILAWADEVARSAPSPYNNWAADFYNADSIAFCGLWMAVVAVRASQGRAERLPPDKYLAALSWKNWGVPVPLDQMAVGDVVVMSRNGGGHVTMCVGIAKGEGSFFGLGANQSDAVTIAEFPMARAKAGYVRRPPYKALPPGARRVILSSSGVFSSNEA